MVPNELPERGTRLLVRTRANYSPRAFGLLSLPLGLVDATYGVAMLRAIVGAAVSGRPDHMAASRSLAAAALSVNDEPSEGAHNSGRLGAGHGLSVATGQHGRLEPGQPAD